MFLCNITVQLGVAILLMSVRGITTTGCVALSRIIFFHHRQQQGRVELQLQLMGVTLSVQHPP
jgi:hypothetical protein